MLALSDNLVIIVWINMIYCIFFIFVMFMLILAGCISGSETAITGASKAQLYHLAKRGDRKAKKALFLQEKIATVLSTILVMNQMMIYVLTTVATIFTMQFCSGAMSGIITTIVGVMIAIYSEILPKMLAIQYTSKYALLISPILCHLVVIFRPIITLLEICAKLSLKIFGINISNIKDAAHADAELRGAIELHATGGDIEETQKKNMLKSILDLGEIPVSYNMIHRKNLKTINGSLSLEKICEELTNCAFSRVPVWKDNPENIVGILKTKTFFRALQLNIGDVNKIKIDELISPPWFIPETMHLLDQLQNFRKKREHFALVVDEYGDLMGCITLEDILEEIVGEIIDEYDTTVSGIKKQNDGSVIADGSTPIRDLNKEFNWDIPEEEAATIAGYVMHEIRKIPDVGQIYSFTNFKVEILRRYRNQISLVKIIPNIVEDKMEENTLI